LILIKYGNFRIGIDINIRGVKIKIGGKYNIDTQDILGDINDGLEQESLDCLISGMAVKKVFSSVSEVKCDTYLSEFPKLRKYASRTL
jgi:hypothetical protein